MSRPAVQSVFDPRSWRDRGVARTVGHMDRNAPPPAGELLLTGALLSLYVGLRGGAWAVGTLERRVAPKRALSAP